MTKYSRSIENIIQKIEKIANKKADELEEKNFQKYKDLFDTTVRFLKGKRILLYGGYALNELMPPSLKIYKENSLPDIDFFSYKPKEIATYLVSKFAKAGYSTASFTEALHPGTYKVFVHGTQVADITSVSLTAFKRLARGSVKGESGLPIVDPQYLRMTLHLLMSQANDSHRWSKVFTRLISFYKQYPPKMCIRKHNEKDASLLIPDELSDELYKTIKEDGYIVFGAHELNLMMDNPKFKFPSSIPMFQCLSENDPEDVYKNNTKLATIPTPYESV